MKTDAKVPSDRMQVMLEKGWVTLRGEVDWGYQRQSASKAACSLTGVVHGSEVTLRGRVDSLAEHSAVFGAAWSAPGVSSVVNELKVRP